MTESLSASIQIRAHIERAMNELTKEIGFFATKKDLRALKQACKDYLDQPFPEIGPSGALSEAEALRVCEPLLNACSTGQPKLASISLSCLHRLQQGGHIAHAADLNLQIAEAAMKGSELADDGAQLAALRSLVSSASAGYEGEGSSLPGEALLRVARSVHNLALLGITDSLRSSARGAFFQVFFYIFFHFIKND